MLFLAVNFHYIYEENKYPFPGIYSTPIERFVNQLEQISQHFDFISQEDLVDAIEGSKKLPEKSCLITFDDGLKSQYENGLPVLRKKGIPAVFFVNTLPFREKKACLVHKIHWLRANLPPEEFLRKINDNLQLVLGKSLNNFSIEDKIAAKKYRYDELKIAKLKFILNNIIAKKYRTKVIDGIFKEIVNDEADFCKMFYMSEKELLDLSKLSFLGIHSDAHQSLSQLSKSQLLNDIDESLKTISKIAGAKKIRGISYPHGGPTDVSLGVAEVCRSLGLKFGFTMERAFNRSLQSPLLFARMSTNDVLGGRAPAFNFENNKLKIFGEVKPSRHIYI